MVREKDKQSLSWRDCTGTEWGGSARLVCRHPASVPCRVAVVAYRCSLRRNLWDVKRAECTHAGAVNNLLPLFSDKASPQKAAMSYASTGERHLPAAAAPVLLAASSAAYITRSGRRPGTSQQQPPGSIVPCCVSAALPLGGWRGNFWSSGGAAPEDRAWRGKERKLASSVPIARTNIVRAWVPQSPLLSSCPCDNILKRNSAGRQSCYDAEGGGRRFGGVRDSLARSRPFIPSECATPLHPLTRFCVPSVAPAPTLPPPHNSRSPKACQSSPP